MAGDETPRPAGEKLQKVLAARGVASRRAVEELIASGRVTVNGRVARLGTRVDRDSDVIEVDGALVSVRPGLVHYLLNKPAAVVTTARDPFGRPTVVDLVPPAPRVHPVGRLDADTEGLLLLTNDGELTHRLTHPRYGIEKEYLVQTDRRLAPGELRRLRTGIELDDGITAPARASQPQTGLVRLTIHEGRNRQVRRMFEALGLPVIRLVRMRIGPIADRRLPLGAWRPLTDDERRALEQATAIPPRSNNG